MRSLLITMSLSGTVVFLLYMCLSPLSKHICSIRWRYGVLKLALFFFIVPVPWFKFNLLEIVTFLFPTLKIPVSAESPKHMKTIYSVTRSKNTVFFSENLKLILIVSFTLLMLALLFIIVQIFQNQKLIQNCERYAVQNITDEKLQTLTKSVGTEILNHHKIHFSESKYIKTPMVMGLFHPHVLLPDECQKNLSENKLKMILRHELYHIKHKDLWFKLLGIAVISLHWYNPFSWLLFYELCSVSELYCDEEVINSFGRQCYREYGEIVIELSTDIGIEHISNNTLYASVSMLGSTKHVTKRRIKEMKKQSSKRLGNLSKLVSCVLAVIICISATVTTFAYAPPVTFVLDDNVEALNFAASDIWFYPEGVIVPEDEEPLPYEFYFTDEQGNIKEIVGEGEGRASCTHSFVAGKVTRHVKNGKGGCKIDYYNVKQCSKCDYTKIVDCYNTITYKVCSH